jgi:hypothetical protein
VTELPALVGPPSARLRVAACTKRVRRRRDREHVSCGAAPTARHGARRIIVPRGWLRRGTAGDSMPNLGLRPAPKIPNSHPNNLVAARFRVEQQVSRRPHVAVFHLRLQNMLRHGAPGRHIVAGAFNPKVPGSRPGRPTESQFSVLSARTVAGLVASSVANGSKSGNSSSHRPGALPPLHASVMAPTGGRRRPLSPGWKRVPMCRRRPRMGRHRVTRLGTVVRCLRDQIDFGNNSFTIAAHWPYHDRLVQVARG